MTSSTTTRDLFGLVEQVFAKRRTEHSDRIFLAQDVAPQPGQSASWERLPLSEPVRAHFRQLYPAGPYRHQARAVEALLGEGRDVVVATRTSSGKSLIYQVPVAETLVSSDRATALLLYPQRALANDQLLKLQEVVPPLLEAAGKPCPANLVARYDGQTSKDERAAIRPAARVLLTNPEMLHLAILAWHEKHWDRFLRNLRYVILDEAHEYRGTFGSNVAMLLRRLLLVCDRLGAAPRFVATSATIADPAKHLECLTGQAFSLVGSDEDGSSQGPKQFWIAQPADHPFELARWLMRELVDAGLSVLCFCQSRQSAERLTRDVGRYDDPDGRVEVYRAGLSSTQRKEIEDGLRTGAIRGVFATSALELGIDIGALDVCICVGFPNTMMSLWQRAGRVGRAGKPGVVIMIPDQRPIDAYYTEHPEVLFRRQTEPLVINMSSRTLATWHYACALHEAARQVDHVAPELLDEPMSRIAEEHRAGSEDPSFYGEPHRNYNLRAGGDRSYEIVVGGDVIGDISRSQLLRETPPNAIYLHGGRTFRVASVQDAPTYRVRLQPERTPNSTRAYVRTAVQLQQCWRVAVGERLRIEQGRLRVSQTLLQLAERNREGKVVAQFPGSQGLKSNLYPTSGIVLTVLRPASLLPPGRDVQAAWNGLTALLSGLLPAVLGPCDLGDYALHPEYGVDEAKLYVYDTAYEGIDLTIQAFDRVSDLVQAAEEQARGCECQLVEGCFRCVRDPFSDVRTDRELTAELLRGLLACLAEPLQVAESPSIDRIAPAQEQAICGTCQAKNQLGQKFCGNCGAKLEG